MKKIGLIGGLGPEATVDYYKELIGSFNNKGGEMIYPEIIIYSVNMSEFLKMFREKDYSSAISFLLEKLHSLKNAGSDFAAITANTPHLLFDEIKEQSPMPLVSIVEATLRETIKKGFKRPGLIGTGFTMNATFYQDVFMKQGIEVIVPEKDDKELINNKLFSEIELGIFSKETRELIIGIIFKMVNVNRIDSIILGCTEFPLLLPESSYAGIPVLNTTRIHVNEIIEKCLTDGADTGI